MSIFPFGLMLKNLLAGLEYDWWAHVRIVLSVELPGAQH
jgi:hypothetical protein